MWSPISTNQRGSEAFDTPKTIYGIAASDFSSQYPIPIARKMAAAVARCSRARSI